MIIEMNKTELVFIPCPGSGHIPSTTQLARLMLDRDDRISATIFIMKIGSSLRTTTRTDSDRLRLLELPVDMHSVASAKNFQDFVTVMVDKQQFAVREVVNDTINSGTKIAAFVIGIFCTSMMDVAKDFDIPTYIYNASSASSVSVYLHLQALRDHHKQDVTDFNDFDAADLVVPGLLHPLPVKFLPRMAVDKEGGSEWLLNHHKRFREAKGIIINTFEEGLESSAVEDLSYPNTDIPTIYPVGPLLNLRVDEKKAEPIIEWMNDQPEKSVVFICFGGSGSFEREQVMEIAYALERIGRPFVWSIRRPPPLGTFGLPTEYEDLNEVLPGGFCERTAKLGKVIGWAPQAAILSHPATGGFVSHCGWNSILESFRFGVPMATWPLYGEQQLNAFVMVKEWAVAADIKMDYYCEYKNGGHGTGPTVPADVIERGIDELFDGDGEIRRKVRDISLKCKLAVSQGGKSHATVGHLIADIISNDKFM